LGPAPGRQKGEARGKASATPKALTRKVINAAPQPATWQKKEKCTREWAKASKRATADGIYRNEDEARTTEKSKYSLRMSVKEVIENATHNGGRHEITGGLGGRGRIKGRPGKPLRKKKDKGQSGGGKEGENTNETIKAKKTVFRRTQKREETRSRKNKQSEGTLRKAVDAGKKGCSVGRMQENSAKKTVVALKDFRRGDHRQPEYSDSPFTEKLGSEKDSPQRKGKIPYQG